MIRKSGDRFSEEIMRKQRKAGALCRKTRRDPSASQLFSTT
jgi:hypothetical protein